VNGWASGPIVARQEEGPDGRARRRRLALAVAVGLVPLIGLLALGGALVVIRSGSRPGPLVLGDPGASIGAPIAPRPAVDPVRSPAPRTLTLTTHDLPAGYHVIREAPAGFSQRAGQAAPASWDVLFAPDGGVAAGGQLIESLAVVYPTAAAADAALDAQVAAERAARAVPRPPISSLGDRVTVWVEPAADDASYEIVRVTWRSLNVVAQVSVLGRSAVLDTDRLALLAAIQQDRIGAPAPVGGGGA